tara:strand:- start:273 stop:1130 length:858 start_codon:yes stop_codon:yes gene_type:complete
MIVLVTGGAGFIGANLIKRLVSEEHTVFSLDNYSTGREENHQEGADYFDVDLRIITDFDVYGPPDVVFHLAANARIQPSFSNPVDYITSNAISTLNLVNWCSDRKIPIIHSGSSSKHSGRFKNPYTFSKDIAEDVIKLYQEHYELKASNARFYNVYGPHQLIGGSHATLVGTWIHNIENQEEPVIYGDGLQKRDFTHVNDIVDALCLIMEKKAYGHDFELGRGKNYSVAEVAEMFKIKPKMKEARKGEARETLNSSTLAKEILGWEPKLELSDYVSEWLKENDKG